MTGSKVRKGWNLVANDRDDSGLPLALTFPGLLLVLSLELLILLGLVEHTPWMQMLLTAVLVMTPWAAVLRSRSKLEALAYKRERFFLHLGWGMVAGGIWRVLSILMNLVHYQLSGFLGTTLDLLALMIWVPFVEETFFRGYLGRSLSRAWGFIPGILVQAVVFTLLPSHISQGWWNMLSIFAFGLLAGWLTEVRRSVWAPWSAHAFANVLPYIARLIH